MSGQCTPNDVNRKISALTELTFLFDTYSIALSELAEIPFELNSLNLYINSSFVWILFTVSNRLD